MASVTDIIASLKKKKDELDRGVNQGLENLRAWANPQVRQTFNREVIQPRISAWQQKPSNQISSQIITKTIPAYFKGITTPVVNWAKTTGEELAGKSNREMDTLLQNQRVQLEINANRQKMAWNLIQQGKINEAKELLSLPLTDYGSYAKQAEQNLAQRSNQYKSNALKAMTTVAGAGKPISIPAYLLSAGIGAVSAKLGGRDPYIGAGSAMANAQRWRGVTQFTDPFIGKTVNTFVKPEFSPVIRQLATRLISGTGNVVEDRIIDRLDSMQRGLKDDIASFLLGAVVSNSGKGAGSFKDTNLTSIKSKIASDINNTFKLNSQERQAVKNFIDVVSKNAKNFITSPEGIRLQSGKINFGTDIGKSPIKPKTTITEIPQQVKPSIVGAEQPEITPEEVNKTRKILTGGGIPTGPKIKVKKLVLRIKSNKNYPKELRSMLEGTYQVSNEDQTIRDAKKLVRLDPVSAEARALNPQNSTDIAIGSELFNHYMDDGNIVKANQILNSTSGTNQGKMVHILARYERTTPQGAVRFATNAIKNFNKSHPNNPLKLTDDNIKGIYTAAKKIRSMPEGRERNIAANELMNQINNLIPSSIADKAITVWKAGLLTSLRTHGRNIIGNTMMGTTEILKDIPASLVDTALSQKTGKRTLTFATRGLGEFGSQKTRQQTADIVTMGYDPSEQINKYDVRHITWGNNIVERALKKYTDVIFKTLAAEDISFWNASYARSLYDQAGAKAINAGKGGNKKYIQNLVDNATEDMKLIATKDANFATFHDKNQLTELANKVKKVLSKNEWTKIAGEVTAPFTGVPSSIVFKTIDYSPIGLIRGIFKAGKVIKPPDLEQIPNLQRQASQEIGRGIIGTGLLGLGAYLASRGLITGQPKNPKEAYQWQLEGKQANSVFLDGKWRSINSVGPQTLVILAGAKYNEEMNKGDRSLTNFALGLAKDQLNQTFLAGIQQPLQAIVDPARYGQPYASSQVSSLVPNIVKDISKSLDKSMRETNNPKEAFQASIPIWRNQLIEKRDVLGNVVPQEPTGFSALIDLFNSKTPISNIVVDELSRLYSVGNPATPSKLSKTQTINGKKVTLTPSQLNTLEAAIAPKLNEALSALIQSNNYLNLDDETKAKAISDTVEKVRKQVKGTIDLDTLSNKKQAELVDNLPQSNTSKIYKIIDKDTGNITTIDLSKPLEPPQLTGFDDIDKLLISSFNNAISTRVSNIVKLFKDGQITAEEANELIDALNKIKQSTKKTKKTTIKIKATPKIKITKAESIPIKIQIPTFRNLNFQTSRQPLRIKPMEIPKIKISKQTSNLI